MKMNRRILELLIVTGLGVTLLGAKSCFKDKPLYPHVNHDDINIACSKCHPTATTLDKAGMPQPETCKECHAVEDQEYDSILIAVKEGKISWPSTSLLHGDELKFSHKKHADKQIECKTCHGDIAKSQSVGKVNIPTMDSCVKCHQEKKVSVECATCHQTIRKDTPPASHDASWKWGHGQVVEQHGMHAGLSIGATTDCMRCHTQSSCSQCHQQEPPRSHNQYWRMRGHGIDASIDRTKCSVCHTTDSCVRCHQENAPQSHVGGWGPPQDTHCISCHDNNAQSCTVCHGGGNKHLSFAPKPPPVVPAHASTNTCLTCHSTGPVAVKHPTNGGDGAYCRSCHQ